MIPVEETKMPEEKPEAATRFKAKAKDAEMKAWKAFDEQAEKLVSLIEDGGSETSIRDAADKFKKALAEYQETAKK